MFLNVIGMTEDRASAAAMVVKKTEKLLALCVNRIWREMRFSVRGRRKSDEIGISKFLRCFSFSYQWMKIFLDYSFNLCFNLDTFGLPLVILLLK